MVRPRNSNSVRSISWKSWAPQEWGRGLKMICSFAGKALALLTLAEGMRLPTWRYATYRKTIEKASEDLWEKTNYGCEHTVWVDKTSEQLFRFAPGLDGERLGLHAVRMSRSEIVRQLRRLWRGLSCCYRHVYVWQNLIIVRNNGPRSITILHLAERSVMGCLSAIAGKPNQMVVHRIENCARCKDLRKWSEMLTLGHWVHGFERAWYAILR